MITILLWFMCLFFVPVNFAMMIYTDRNIRKRDPYYKPSIIFYTIVGILSLIPFAPPLLTAMFVTIILFWFFSHNVSKFNNWLASILFIGIK